MIFIPWRLLQPKKKRGFMKAKKVIIVRYHFLVKVERGGMIVHAASNPQNNCKKIEFFVCLK